LKLNPGLLEIPGEIVYKSGATTVEIEYEVSAVPLVAIKLDVESEKSGGRLSAGHLGVVEFCVA